MYQVVMVYQTDGVFLGYSIKDDKAIKLQTTNLYADNEAVDLEEHLNRLNQDVKLRTTWPKPDDPDVMALLADPDFIPIEMHMAEVVDDENSEYCYVKNSIGEREIDRDASSIVTKTMEVPVRPSDAITRIRTACEEVAKQRAA